MDNVLLIVNTVVLVLGPIITIIGFVISSKHLKTTFNNDIKKIQEEKVYSKIEDLPYELLKIMREIFEAKDDSKKMMKAARKLYDLEDKIIAYGSEDAIEICCYIQEALFTRKDVDPMETMAAFGLLISQLKKDLTNKIMLPNVFYRMTITDYVQQKDSIIRFSNSIVAKLNLDRGFMCK